MLSLKVPGKKLFQAFPGSSLVCGNITSSSHTVLPMPVSLFIGTTVMLDRNPLYFRMSSSKLMASKATLFPNKVKFWAVLRHKEELDMLIMRGGKKALWDRGSGKVSDGKTG